MNSKSLYWSIIIAIAILANMVFASPSQKYIVRYKSPPSGLSLQGLTTAKLSLPGATSIDHSITLSEVSKDTVLAQLENDPNVDFVEPVYPVHLYSTPNDTWYKNQSYLVNTDLNLLTELDAFHDTLVAVLDTGVDLYHEDLAGQFYRNTQEVLNGLDDDGNGVIDDVSGYNFLGASDGGGDNNPQDGHGHGTHISGIIAAKSDNSLGITGLHEETKILPVKFINNQGIGTQLDAALAIRYAVDMGADVINCSWGFYASNTVLKEAIDYAIENGVIVVAAIGNSGSAAREYPAAFEGVFTIGASTQSKSRTYFSSYGDHLDFLIYGSRIFSTDTGNSYTIKSGTSQSAAVMSGVISKLLAHDNTLTPSDVYTLIKTSSSESGSKSTTKGYGTLNTTQLLSALDSPVESTTVPSEIEPESTEALTVTRVLNFPNPISTSTTFGFETNTAGAIAEVTIYSIQGAIIDTLTQITVSGYNRIEWTPNNLANGTYMYTLQVKSDSGDTLKKKTLTILK